MKSYLALATLVVTGMIGAFPGTAQAASVGPASAEIRVAAPDNWIDNAAAPTTTALGARAILAAGLDVRGARPSIESGVVQREVEHISSELLKVTLVEAIAEVRAIAADIAGRCAVS